LEDTTQVQLFIRTYGYFAILILMVAEAACVPIPLDLTMPFGGAIALRAAPGVHLSEADRAAARAVASDGPRYRKAG
jgi:membrane protein DedA with SNARE-associated domain